MKREYLIPGSNGYSISCMEWIAEQENAVLICLHGFAGDKYSSVVNALGNCLSMQSVRVVAFDWPGHGASPAGSDQLTIANCLEDLKTVIHDIDLPDLPHYLFATSFGGFLGLHYVMQNPSVFSKIILRSPAISMPDTFLSLLTDQEHLQLQNGSAIDKGYERPLILRQSFADDLRNHKLNDPVLACKIPGIIIQGDLDDVVCMDDSVAFAQRNDWNLHIIHGADHRFKNPGELDEIVAVARQFFLGD